MLLLSEVLLLALVLFFDLAFICSVGVEEKGASSSYASMPCRDSTFFASCALD